MNKFIARYTDSRGIKKSIAFDKSRYNQKQAENVMKEKGIQNFFFFFEPLEPTTFGENGIYFQGEVGFDITMDSIMPHINEGKELYIDTFGGDLWEGWKIHDAIKLSNLNPKITVLGTCASSGMQILLSTSPDSRIMTEQSRLLIHNPWTWEEGDDEQMQKNRKRIKARKRKACEVLFSDFWKK